MWFTVYCILTEINLILYYFQYVSSDLMIIEAWHQKCLYDTKQFIFMSHLMWDDEKINFAQSITIMTDFTLHGLFIEVLKMALR